MQASKKVRMESTVKITYMVGGFTITWTYFFGRGSGNASCISSPGNGFFLSPELSSSRFGCGESSPIGMETAQRMSSAASTFLKVCCLSSHIFSRRWLTVLLLSISTTNAFSVDSPSMRHTRETSSVVGVLWLEATGLFRLWLRLVIFVGDG